MIFLQKFLTCTNHTKVMPNARYRNGEYLAREIFSKPCRLKLLVRKTQQISNSQCICHIRFRVSVNIGEENFAEWLTICQIHQFFPYQNFPMYSTFGCKTHTYVCIAQTYMYTFIANASHKILACLNNTHSWDQYIVIQILMIYIIL